MGLKLQLQDQELHAPQPGAPRKLLTLSTKASHPNTYYPKILPLDISPREKSTYFVYKNINYSIIHGKNGNKCLLRKKWK